MGGHAIPPEEPPQQPGTVEAADFLARAMADELARQHPLPLTARSRTRGEIDRRSQRFTIVALAIFCPIAFAALAALTFGGGSAAGRGGLGASMTLLVVALIIGIFVFGAFRARKWRAYRDPHIVLDVREDGIAIRSPGHSSLLRYPDAQYSFETMALVTKLEVSDVFVGIRLATPLGELRIDDDHFRAGRIAAAAIAFRKGGHASAAVV